MFVSLIGSNGFLSGCIGKYCSDKGYTLNVYGRTAPDKHHYNNFFKIDLQAEELNIDELLQSDVIIYAAGGGIQFHLKEGLDPIYKLNVNVPVATINRLKQASFNGTFISFGSYFEIGETDGDKTFTELELLQSQLKVPNDYAISKRMLTRFMGSFSTSFNYLHFILPTIYGENESTYRLIPYTLKAIESNENLNLTSGTQVRQYIYINDAVNIIFSAIEKNIASGIYNMPAAEEFSVKELVTLLYTLKQRSMPDEIFGKTERIDVGMKVLKLNSEKLQSQINYRFFNKVSDIYSKYKFDFGASCE